MGLLWGAAFVGRGDSVSSSYAYAPPSRNSVARRDAFGAFDRALGFARAIPDDLAREVYCVLGMPLDAVEMAEILRRIDIAASAGVPYLVSTVNLNFLINCQSDETF